MQPIDGADDSVATQPAAGRSAEAGYRKGHRARALSSALRKRDAGVPTYSVQEAAALLSVSAEYLYRLIQSNDFPAVRMPRNGQHGRYVVPAKAVEQLIECEGNDQQFDVARAGGDH